MGLPKRSKVVAKNDYHFTDYGQKRKIQPFLNNALDGKKLVMPEDLRCIASISDTIRDSNNIDVYRVEGYFIKVAWENASVLLTETKNPVVLLNKFKSDSQ